MKTTTSEKVTSENLISAAKSHYGSQYNFELRKNNWGRICLLMVKDVVDVVTNEDTQITSRSARSLLGHEDIGAKIARRLPLINPVTGAHVPDVILSNFELVAVSSQSMQRVRRDG